MCNLKIYFLRVTAREGQLAKKIYEVFDFGIVIV